MRINMKSTCKNCEERYPACHDSCPKYLQFKSELEAEKKIIYRERAKEDDWLQYKKDLSRKLRGKR